MNIKEKIEDYTEQEFLQLLGDFFGAVSHLDPDPYEQHIDTLVQHFSRLTEHPAGSDLIFYPPEGKEDSPEGILQSVKEWRAANGKPGFKTA